MEHQGAPIRVTSARRGRRLASCAARSSCGPTHARRRSRSPAGGLARSRPPCSSSSAVSATPPSCACSPANRKGLVGGEPAAQVPAAGRRPRWDDGMQRRAQGRWLVREVRARERVRSTPSIPTGPKELEDTLPKSERKAPLGPLRNPDQAPYCVVRPRSSRSAKPIRRRRSASSRAVSRPSSHPSARSTASTCVSSTTCRRHRRAGRPRRAPRASPTSSSACRRIRRSRCAWSAMRRPRARRRRTSGSPCVEPSRSRPRSPREGWAAASWTS